MEAQARQLSVGQTLMDWDSIGAFETDLPKIGRARVTDSRRV